MKKVLGMFIVTMMISLNACSSNSSTSEEVNDNTTINNIVNETTTAKMEDSIDKLSDEYLLSLPETPADEFKYEKIDGGISITRYTGNEEIVVVPAEIDGIKVVQIGYDAFSNMPIDAVVTGKNVHTIESSDVKGAFCKCKLKNVVINGPLTYIGENAFSHSELESITFPDTLTTISRRAFCNTKIKNIEIPGSVELIDYKAFSGNDFLEEVIINEGVVKIWSEAFGSCTNLRRVTLPASLTSIRKDAFDGSLNVTIITPAGSKAEKVAKEKGISIENN